MAGELGKASLDLEANLGDFERNVGAADVTADQLRDTLAAVAAIANVAEGALNDVRLNPANAATTRVSAEQIIAGVHGISDEARLAALELDQVKIGETQAVESMTSAAQIVAALDTIDAAAADARRSLEGLGAVSAAGGAAGGIGGMAGLIGAAGWGRGGSFMGIGGLAGFGSVLGLAGFGLEHVITSIVGIIGSMLGGLLGGGLLGLGALGTSAVGMGTDLAGIGQAAGDIKQVNTALGNLNTAIAEYGKHSQQAAQAQAALNQTLGSFSPVARGAVLAAAQTAQGFKQMFDQATGQAEKTGAEIINQAMHVGEAFLPTIGKFAAENMAIIQRQLQPLFAWLQNPGFQKAGFGGGLGIFTNLEQIFQRNLPAAVQAGSQAFEFFIRTVDVAAQQTGHLMQTLDNFFTRMNQPGNFASWAGEVDKLIGLFRSWMGLLGAAIKLVAAVFKPAVGFGKAFAVVLTQIINQIRSWINLTSTQATLHSLFSVHLVEVIQGLGGVLKALLPAIEAATTAFMKMEIVLSGLAGGALKAFATLIRTILRIPFASTLIGWAAALALVYKANLLLLTMLGRILRILPAVATEETAVAGAEAEMGAAATAAATESVGAFAAIRAGAASMLGPLAAAVAIVYALDKALAKLTGFDALNKAWGTAGWGADNLNDAIPKPGSINPYPQGTSDYFEFQAGYMGVPRGQHKVVANMPAGYVDPSNAAYKRGAAARKKAEEERKKRQRAAQQAAKAARNYGKQYATRAPLPTGIPTVSAYGPGGAYGTTVIPAAATRLEALAARQDAAAAALGYAGKKAERDLEKEISDLQQADKILEQKMTHAHGRERTALYNAITANLKKIAEARKRVAAAMTKERQAELQFAVDQAAAAVQNAAPYSKAWEKAIAAEEKALKAEIAYWAKRANNDHLSLAARDAALKKEMAYQKQLKQLTTAQVQARAENEAQFLSSFVAIQNAFGSNVVPVPGQSPAGGKTNTHLYDIKQEARETNRHLKAIRRKGKFTASEEAALSAMAVTG